MSALRRLGLGSLLALFCAAAVPCAGQQAMPSVGQLQLEQFLGQAGARSSEYFALFKDLTAEETKTVEEFRGSGAVSERRQILSDFIVYRSQLDNGSISEYRDVRAVDGVPVAGREQRVLALFEKGGRAGSVRDELARIGREGSRYDLDHTVSGLTIGQALPLQPWARAFFDFSRVGEERIGDRTVLVVAYQQAVPNPRFGFDLSLPSELRRAEPLYRGRLWLDATTARLWREVREVTVQPPGSVSAVVVQRTEFEYEPSRFDLLLPKKIVFSAFLRFSKTDSGMASALDYRVTFAYGPFRHFTTTSDEGEIASVAPPEPEPEPAPTPAPAEVATAASPDASLGPEFGPDAPTGPPPSTPAPVPSPAPARAVAAPSAGPLKPPPPVTRATLLLAETRRDPRLPASVPPPSPPVVSVPLPPPPPAPGGRFRLPPS